MITAGHCGSVGNTIKHNGEAIGNLNFNAINPSTFKGVDVARIRVTGADYPHVQNTLYATDSYKLWSLTSVSATRQLSNVGQGVGKSGVHGYASGSITDTHVYYQLIPADGDPPLALLPKLHLLHENDVSLDVWCRNELASYAGATAAGRFTQLLTSARRWASLCSGSSASGAIRRWRLRLQMRMLSRLMLTSGAPRRDAPEAILPGMACVADLHARLGRRQTQATGHQGLLHAHAYLPRVGERPRMPFLERALGQTNCRSTKSACSREFARPTQPKTSLRGST